MRATRDAFGDSLVFLGKKHDNVLVLNADLGSATRALNFKKQFPDRFFEIGIAEANMIGIASGLSEYGYKVFLSSFGSFLTGRYDIIRCSIAYPKRPVVLVGTHSGLGIGKDGTTQMGLEDVSLMRSLPNMIVVQPSTPKETEDIMNSLIGINSPVYLRLGRQPISEVDFIEEYKFGKLRKLQHGDDVTIIFSGCVANVALELAKLLKDQGLSSTILNAHTLKPFDHETLINELKFKSSNLIIAIEDHSIIGGLGTIIADTLSEYFPAKLIKIGINDVFASSGEPDDLYKYYGIDASSILKRL